MFSLWPTWESIVLTFTMINLIFLFKHLTNISWQLLYNNNLYILLSTLQTLIYLML